LKQTHGIVLLGIVLAGIKIALLPFQRALPVALFSDLIDCALTVLLMLTAWRASRRSHSFARSLWLSVTAVSALWAPGFALAIYADAAPRNTLNLFWPDSMAFYLVAVVFIAPLLLREGQEKPGIDWLQTLDLAQLGILGLSAYLAFFYIPSVTGLSPGMRAFSGDNLHLLRDGFLAIAFLYRGLRSQVPDFRRLQLRLAMFFVVFTVTDSLYVAALIFWHWPRLLVGFICDFPVLFLLVTAVGWKQQNELPATTTEDRKDYRRAVWIQLLSLVMPLLVVVMASRITTRHPRVAWSMICLSFACYAARLFVTQQRQNRIFSRLMAVERKFSLAFDSSPVAVGIVSMSTGRYLDVNGRFLELMQMERAQIVGKTSLELGVFDSVESRSAYLHDVYTLGQRNRRLKARMSGGRELDVVISVEVIEIEGESLLLTSMLDVTELTTVTHQLQQVQKMELVGSLAGGVAHDFNNLLTIIKGYSELARSRDIGPELAEEIRQIGQAADRAAMLTRQLLAFSRRQILQPRNVGLNSVVAGIEKLLRRTIGANIEMVTFLASDAGNVHVDPVQMEQVVMNLAVNSRDAMPFGGKLIFETRSLEFDLPYEGEGFSIPAGCYVMLAVTDTGTGISSEHQRRIFEPFFTTKENGRGTGLGLSTVFGIIKQSHGYISVYSEPGTGTTFKIYLPRVDQPAEEFKNSETGRQKLDGTETILLVEDDQLVRDLAATVLARRGYRVIAAKSGEDALCQAAGWKGPIHLLLSDIIMARMSGTVLAERLQMERPDLKLLFISGYPHFSVPGSGEIDSRYAVLAKPFTPSELAREVRTVLDRKDSNPASEVQSSRKSSL
jgi:PAS domain S-box-containing protein